MIMLQVKPHVKSAALLAWNILASAYMQWHCYYGSNAQAAFRQAPLQCLHHLQHARICQRVYAAASRLWSPPTSQHMAVLRLMLQAASARASTAERSPCTQVRECAKAGVAGAAQSRECATHLPRRTSAERERAVKRVGRHEAGHKHGRAFAQPERRTGWARPAGWDPGNTDSESHSCLPGSKWDSKQII